MKIKFTLVDYIIIILVICAVAFAFIHITSDNSSSIQKTAFDASTINKLPETYLNYYKDGKIVKSTVTGSNATNGEKVTLNGITSLGDLNKNLTNCDFEISTSITVDSIDSVKMQELDNKLDAENQRFSIKTTNTEFTKQLVISKATSQNIKDGDSVLGNIKGLTDDITIRVYNCSDSDMNNIKNNYEVTNIRTF